MLVANEEDGCSFLSKFVQKKLKLVEGHKDEDIKFINGNAFYEFKREEDLQYYKDVIFWNSKTDEIKVLRPIPALNLYK